MARSLPELKVKPRGTIEQTLDEVKKRQKP
jgi:hypothetical protein